MREIDEFSDDSGEAEIKDYTEHSLTIEERDEIIRRYNVDFLGSSRKDTISKNVGSIDKPSLEQQAFPLTLENYEELLDCFPQVRDAPTFERDDHHARAYYGIKEVLRSGELSHLSARAQWKELSKRYSVEWSTIKPWFTQGKFPRNIHRLETLELSRLRMKFGIESPEQIRRQYIPSNLEEYEELLRIHPYAKEHPDIDNRDRYARTYFEVMTYKEANPDATLGELSTIFDIPKGAALSWIYKNAVPCIFQQLASYERYRIEFEDALSEEGKKHHIAPTMVYETLKALKDIEDVSPSTMAESLNKFCEMIPEDQHMVFAHLKPYHRKIDPQWLIEVGKTIEDNLSEVEQALNERESDDSVRYKLGVVDRTLYIWKRNIDPFGYLEIFNDECFYFNKEDGRELVDDTRRHLNLKGNYQLSKLLRQMTDIDEGSRKSNSDVTADLRHDRDHLFGETLRFMLDVTGKNLHDIAPKIQAIGQQEQIKTPRIIEGTELLVLMARLYAITASDGHVGRKWNFLGYSEHNEERIEIVNQIVQNFGEVRYSYFYDKGKKFLVFPTKEEAGLRFPHVLGRLMIKLGMPSGDKSIQNVGLPDFILNGPPEVIRAYLEEVIPEDGWITRYVGIGRNTVLYDATKAEQYKFTAKISTEHIDIIQKYGRQKEGQVESIDLAIGKLQELASSSGEKDSSIASELLRIAFDTPVTLLDHEHRILERLDITSIGPILQGVSWYEKTKRVSARWKLVVTRQHSIAKWGLQALPNDIIKREKLKKWMERNSSVVLEAEEQLVAKGLLPKRMDY
jgi:intein/homing endonuclease